MNTRREGHPPYRTRCRGNSPRASNELVSVVARSCQKLTSVNGQPTPGTRPRPLPRSLPIISHPGMMWQARRSFFFIKCPRPDGTHRRMSCEKTGRSTASERELERERERERRALWILWEARTQDRLDAFSVSPRCFTLHASDLAIDLLWDLRLWQGLATLWVHFFLRLGAVLSAGFCRGVAARRPTRWRLGSPCFKSMSHDSSHMLAA